MKLRTFEEIAEQCKKIAKDDMLGWNIPDYVSYLPYKYAKEYLKDDVTEESWKEDLKEYTLDNVIAVMKDYLSFAFGKAEGERGISSNRNIDHYKNWFWLLGEDEMSEGCWDNYHSYGLPKLRVIEKWLEENK